MVNVGEKWIQLFLILSFRKSFAEFNFGDAKYLAMFHRKMNDKVYYPNEKKYKFGHSYKTYNIIKKEYNLRMIKNKFNIAKYIQNITYLAEKVVTGIITTEYIQPKYIGRFKQHF